MKALLRLAGPVLVLVAATLTSSAAAPKDIDAAIEKGTAFLKKRYAVGIPAGGQGIGGTALAGLALLENRVPADDPAIKRITAAVRDDAYTQTQTYQISLDLLYLDRLGDRADAPLIQLLAVRLIAGQNADGGWTYGCIDDVPAAQERELRTKLRTETLVAGGGKPARNEPPGKPGVSGRLHPVVEKYAQGLLVANRAGKGGNFDDNSNTQFAILAIWVARRHGVPVEDVLTRIEKRFLISQTPTGGWPYAFLLGEGSPSMTCAGLLGLATAVARREERLETAPGKKFDPPKPPPKAEKKTDAKADDPFFNPPPRPAEPPPPKKVIAPKHAPDLRDQAVERGFANLAQTLNGNARRNGRGAIVIPGRAVGDRDLYFLWSLERVGVVYGVKMIGGVDWYQYGADLLLPNQNGDGSWGGLGAQGAEVDTAFALLFLARSNLVRDLSTKVQRDTYGTELRSGDGPFVSNPGGPTPPAAPPMPPPIAPMPPAVAPMPKAGLPEIPVPTNPGPPAKPLPMGGDAARLAAELIQSPAEDWAKALMLLRDAKGADNTQALVLAIPRVDGEKRRQVRDALAERLTRMTAPTLRGMMKADDPELRRAAVLAGAMKDDRDHIPDLIERLTDDAEPVVRAARAGLRSLSGEDFGPEPTASKDSRIIAAAAWTTWWNRQKK